MSAQAPQPIEPVGEDQILSATQAAFGCAARITHCAQIDGGHFNTLYDIKTSNPDQHVVLRIAPRDNVFLYRYERTMMLAEPFIYELIGRAGVPTMDVLAVDGSRSIIDRDYMIAGYIDAVTMRDPSVPQEARPHLRREAGRYTARIHTISGSKFGWITPDGSVRGSDSWAEVFGELMEQSFAAAREAGIISKADCAATLRCFGDHRAVFDEVRSPVLVHNDIWDPNIMVACRNEEWRIEAMIDADRAVYADREFEPALWEDADDDFLAGYGTPLDASPSAMLRRQFYRMQLYAQYAWYYLVMRPTPDFQAHSKRVVMEGLSGLLGG